MEFQELRPWAAGGGSSACEEGGGGGGWGGGGRQGTVVRWGLGGHFKRRMEELGELETLI